MRSEHLCFDEQVHFVNIYLSLLHENYVYISYENGKTKSYNVS